MKLPYVFVFIFIFIWSYYIVVTEPPYGLNRTPEVHDEITTERVRDYPPKIPPVIIRP